MKLLNSTFTGFLALSVGCLLLIVVQGISATSTSGQMLTNKNSRQSYVSDEVLVKFKPTASVQAQQQSINSLGVKKIRTLDRWGWAHLKLPQGFSVDRALTVYKNDPMVETAQPNYIYRIASAPNDPNYGQQWALKNTGQTINNSLTQPPSSSVYATNNPGTLGNDMDLELAWDHLTDSDCSAVTVAVIDTGVNYNHIDLAGNMWNGNPNHGDDFIDGDSDPMDLNGHGTHLAGIIGAVGNNGSGTAGVCWKASIMAVRVLDAAGNGSTVTIAQGVNFAVAQGAKVINMSLGGGGFDSLFNEAITDAQSNGVVVVVAAGNAGSNNDSGSAPFYPCNFNQSNLVCVAALDQKYQLATFSNYGASSVDIGAPGTNILSQWAGTNAVFPDSLTTGWTFNPTTGGWGSVNMSGSQYLLNPTNYPSGQYNNNADDRAFKSFNIIGDAVVLNYFRATNIKIADNFRVGYDTTGVAPFSGSEIIVDDVTDEATYPFFLFASKDITGCISATCSIGFQLKSNDTLTDRGVAITGFEISTLTLNTTIYNTINGTSMSSPHVAGVAALVWAYNPSYTYTQVVNAIKNGGEEVVALSGKTTSGKAVNAMGALAYINPPTGLTASVQ